MSAMKEGQDYRSRSAASRLARIPSRHQSHHRGGKCLNGNRKFFAVRPASWTSPLESGGRGGIRPRARRSSEEQRTNSQTAVESHITGRLPACVRHHIDAPCWRYLWLGLESDAYDLARLERLEGNESVGMCGSKSSRRIDFVDRIRIAICRRLKLNSGHIKRSG